MRHVQHKVWLNNVSLSEAHPSILVLSAMEAAPKTSVSAMNWLGRDGGIVVEDRREQLTVKVDFAIRERKDREEWFRAFQAARSWCGSGTLETFTRPGQTLDVICTKLPEPKAKIFDTLSAEFTAYGWPYWREKNARTASVTAGTDGSLWVPGDGIPTPVDVTVTIPSTGILTSLTVTAGDTSIVLNGNIRGGAPFTFTHDDNGILSIKRGTSSILSYRTAASSDDLMITSGTTSTLSVSSGSAVFSARGCYR